LGYLLEADARWWKLYCAACQITSDALVDAWRRPKLESDREYFRLTDRAIETAERQIRQRDTAEMRFYAGMGYAMRGRLLGLRNEYRATAGAGKRMREHLARAVELDPDLADAYLGLGLYNYYVDTLSPFAKIFRVFMGLPGGNKKDGMKQLGLAAAKGQLISVEAQFYLAKCLRNYDRDYARSAGLFEKLVESYPANPIFRIMLAGDFIRTNELDRAEREFEAVAQPPAPGSDTLCADQLRELAGKGLTYTRSLKNAN
jgi:tetratricopeptide (TPR) repeat protein